MDRKEAKELVSGIQLTEDDNRTFETFQSLTKKMEEFQAAGVVVLTVGSRERTLKVGPQKTETRKVTEFDLQPEAQDDAAKTRMILAYNSRNLYLPTGESLHTIGAKNVDEAVSALAAFTVTKVEMTGEYPMRKSIAAENLGFTPDKEMSSDDWSRLREKYDETAENRGPAKAAIYKAEEVFEIPKIHIAPVN